MIVLRILQYILLGFIDVGFGILARLFFNWWVPLFCDENGNLPNWLKWFGTFDATLDSGWKDNYPGFDPNGSRYWNRVKWLYRNTSYGFSYWVTGIKFDPKEWTVKTYIDKPGYTYFLTTSSKGYFNLFYHGPNGEYKLGWKAWNYFLNLDDKGNPVWKDKPWGPEWRTQYVLTPNPFKKNTA